MSEIAIAEPEQIAAYYDTEHAGLKHRVPPEGNYAPYGIAGIVSNGAVVCPDCATEEELRDDNDIGGAVFGDAEFDAPAMCHDCGKVLRVTQLVYPDVGTPGLYEHVTSE